MGLVDRLCSSPEFAASEHGVRQNLRILGHTLVRPTNRRCCSFQDLQAKKRPIPITPRFLHLYSTQSGVQAHRSYDLYGVQVRRRFLFCSWSRPHSDGAFFRGGSAERLYLFLLSTSVGIKIAIETSLSVYLRPLECTVVHRRRPRSSSCLLPTR